ncbi:MAG: hypothetical protein WAK17_17855 [Candidatus Nitrosopolaris sp.]
MGLYCITPKCYENREVEKALSDLEKAIEIGGDIYIKYAKEDQDFDDIRSLLRFKMLIKNTGAV